ncbi:MAG: UbiA family prenyltransferase [Candidatus Micrarchaeota archaeon]
MLTKKFFAFLKLVRFEHAIMFALAVFIAEIITAREVLFTQKIIFSLLVPIFSEIGAFAMNDLLDIETDRINRKINRPLVSGLLSPQFALTVIIISFALALFFAYLVSPNIFLFALMINLLAVCYNFWFKLLPLVGNIYIAFTMAIPFIFGNYVISETLDPLNILIALMGFCVGLGREIVKTTEDIRGDMLARRSKALPALIGSEKSLIISGILYLIFVAISVVLYLLYLKVGIGFALVLIADVIFLYSSLNLVFLKNKEFLRVSGKSSLIALFIGLVGILFSVLECTFFL